MTVGRSDMTRGTGTVCAMLLLVFVGRVSAEDVRPDPQAPPELGAVVPTVAWPAPPGALFSNLAYLGNNEEIRGARSGSGLYSDGDVVAARWRSLASRVSAVFVLRHGVFTQQDHPFEQRSYAPTLPPSWVTIAIENTRRGAAWPDARMPWLGDDASWMRIDIPAAFAPFPMNRRLVEVARNRGIDRAGMDRARNARITIRALAEHVRVLREASVRGQVEVARAGGQRIAATDRTYFADARAHVIPITVEHAPPAQAGAEPMGFDVPGRTLSPASIREAAVAVLGARLDVGPMAIAQYDVTVEAERAHVRELLAALVPRRSTGNIVWIHMHAGPRTQSGSGLDAFAHVARFQAELRDDPRIAFERVRILLLPATAPAPAEDVSTELVAARRARDIGVALGIDAPAALIPRRLAR